MAGEAIAGAFVVRDAVDRATRARWRRAIDAHPAWAARRGDGFVAQASSLPLGSIGTLDDVDAALAAVWRGACSEVAGGALGDDAALAVDACWVRRQYAPHRYPPQHAPHAWHQDGALGCDFDAAAPSLLPMLTCWLALDDCGVDAPGLELAPEAAAAPLSPAALAAFASPGAWRPALRAGDALVFTGAVVHRTHVAPTMRHDRTSLELRLVRGIGCDRAGRLRRLHA